VDYNVSIAWNSNLISFHTTINGLNCTTKNSSSLSFKPSSANQFIFPMMGWAGEIRALLILTGPG
jgi:hypothetical protein